MEQTVKQVKALEQANVYTEVIKPVVLLIVWIIFNIKNFCLVFVQLRGSALIKQQHFCGINMRTKAGGVGWLRML